jgi:ADP-heptose:LPS heptosyltransferase
MAQTRTITPAKLRKIAALDIALRPLLALAPRPHRPRATPPAGMRILVVELWGLGDLVLVTPLLAELRERFPTAHVTLLAKPAAQQLLAGSRLVDDIVTFDFPWTAFDRKYSVRRYSLGRMMRLFKDLRARSFDVTLDARRDIRSNVVTYLTGAARRIGYDFGGATHLLTDAVPSGSQQAHKIEDWMGLLEPLLGVTPAPRTPVLTVTEAERAAAARTLRELGFDGRREIVAIHPGASRPVRRVREDIVRDVAAGLVRRGADVLLILDPDEHGAAFRLPPEVRAVRPTLRELMALIASADALVCSDSAAMHMAVALDTPVTAIFGPQRHEWYGSRNPRDRVVCVEEMPCRPCFDACIYSSPICMDRITGAQVLGAVSSQLKRAAAPIAAVMLHLALALTPAPLRAQAPSQPVLNIGVSEELDRWRLSQLRDTTPASGLLLRSTSSLLGQGGARGFMPIGARIVFVNNTNLPFGTNSGALWTGRGANVSASGGFAVNAGRLRFILAPELVYSANGFVERDTERFYAPPIPPDRSPYTLVWYTGGPFSADYPIRFGDEPIRRLTPGQSSAALRLGVIEIGAGTENQWWGPGFRNALILSNAAPGFPHLFVRSARPWRTRLGDVEFRWLVGGLSESDFFDTTSANDLRSLAAAAVTLEPWWARNLTLGASRSVMGTATGWGEIPLRWADIFRRTGEPNDRPQSDSALRPGGREQIYALFARWRFPRSGFELHAEWGRTEVPKSLRDLLVSPNHTQAYTLGAQWRSSPKDRFWRLQTEATSLEQSPTFRERPQGVWYASRKIIQGYTNRGRPLGAGVGPGSSGQWLALDRFTTASSVGVYLARTRNNEAVRAIYEFPQYVAYCTHDVTVFGGARGSAFTRFGYIALDFTIGNRINLWFQNGAGCPRGDAQIDVRNHTLSITLKPFARRSRSTSP